jgi:dienelactone hydrolase
MNRTVWLLLMAGVGCHQQEAPRPIRAETREEPVRFASGDVTLAGTLILPGRGAPFPAVFLFHGSGPSERDLSTAHWFAQHGIAALAYDKRGVGESTGDFRSGPFMDLCDDGLAAAEYLKSRHEIDPHRIGVWGISQGGWLGPLAASRSKDVSFVIAVSGPGVSPGEQMLVYYANELRDRGVSEKDVLEATALRRDVWTYLFTGKGYEEAHGELERARQKPWFESVNSQQDGLFSLLKGPSDLNRPEIVRFRREMTYDPLLALRALHVPALFLFGADDRLIPVQKSVDLIRSELTRSGYRDFTIRVFDHDDHGMYDPAGLLDPRYQQTMEDWLAAHLQRSKKAPK